MGARARVFRLEHEGEQLLVLSLPTEVSVEGLTPAERDVLALVRRGLSNAEIATLRGRSRSTVANQVSALLRKLGVPSRAALAART